MPGGLFAVAVLALLAIEIVITLADFVEEDVSRKLPASERVTHALLAINYGGVLALLVPVLWTLTGAQTGLSPVSYGWFSGLATIAAVGCAAFAVRDWAASTRCLRLETRSAAPLMAALPPRQTVLVTGATGFIGRRVVEALVARGHPVIALVRNPNPDVLLARPLTLITSLDQISDETRIDAVINLAGEPIANGLWTEAKRARIVSSRVETTNAVVALIGRLAVKPRALVNGSAIGWYGLWQDEPLAETSPFQECFSHEICEAWETAARRAETYGVRVVLMRIGLVLGTEGGFLTRMLTPFEFGLGGRLGNGQQWMSWIGRDDLVRMIAFAITNEAIKGPLNGTAPEPVTNSDFTMALGRALGRPAVIPVPAFLLRLVGGGLARELLLGGQKVLPRAALAAGFVFEHGTLDAALSGLLGHGQAPEFRREAGHAQI